MTHRDPIPIPFADRQQMCSAARDYRRKQLIEDGVDPSVASEMVWTSVPGGELVPDAEGWVHIANLMCERDGLYWLIKYHVETKRLRIYGPKE